MLLNESDFVAGTNVILGIMAQGCPGLAARSGSELSLSWCRSFARLSVDKALTRGGGRVWSSREFASENRIQLDREVERRL